VPSGAARAAALTFEVPMPGTATLDPDVLVDDLMETIDELRGEIPVELGARQYRVFTVLRTWSGVERGDGTFADVETEITPRPLVQPRTRPDQMQPAGLDEVDGIVLREVSFSYTEAELAGSTRRANQEWLIRLKDGYGQAIRTRDYVLEGSPTPDRIKDIGWTVTLRRAPDAVSLEAGAL
jgi:hypothetical protein